MQQVPMLCGKRKPCLVVVLKVVKENLCLCDGSYKGHQLLLYSIAWHWPLSFSLWGTVPAVDPSTVHWHLPFSWPVKCTLLFSPSKNLKHSTGIPANCVTKRRLRHFIQRAWRGKQYNPLHNNCPWATWWIWKVLINLQLCLQVKCALINTGNEEVQIPGLINLLSGENSISAGPMAFESHLGNIF